MKELVWDLCCSRNKKGIHSNVSTIALEPYLTRLHLQYIESLELPIKLCKHLQVVFRFLPSTIAGVYIDFFL